LIRFHKLKLRYLDFGKWTKNMNPIGPIINIVVLLLLLGILIFGFVFYFYIAIIVVIVGILGLNFFRHIKKCIRIFYLHII